MSGTPQPLRTVYDVLRDVKKCVVFLGTTDSNGRLKWDSTGFIVNLSNVFYLVTAKHAVADIETGKINDEGLLAWYNLKPGGAFFRSVSDLKKSGYEWLFHEKPEVDLALLPFSIIPATDDLLTVPETMFETTDHLFETLDLVYFAFQPGTEDLNKVAPVIRTGMLSRINDDRTFLLDGSVFPGNSGCPVFVKPSAARFYQKGTTLGGDPLAFRFVGVIESSIPDRDVAVSRQTGLPRVIFEENTGLSRVWSADYLLDIARSSAFKEQVERIKQSPQNQD